MVSINRFDKYAKRMAQIVWKDYVFNCSQVALLALRFREGDSISNFSDKVVNLSNWFQSRFSFLALLADVMVSKSLPKGKATQFYVLGKNKSTSSKPSRHPQSNCFFLLPFLGSVSTSLIHFLFSVVISFSCVQISCCVHFRCINTLSVTFLRTTSINHDTLYVHKYM